MIHCCRLLDVRSFVLEVRPGTGNNVLINFYQRNVAQQRFQCATSPLGSQSWLRRCRSLLVAPSGFPHLPSCHPLGRSAIWPNWLCLLRLPKLERGSPRAGPRLVEGLSKGSGALQGVISSLFPRPFSLPTGPRLGELEGLGEKARICLLPDSPPHDHPSTAVWVPLLTVVS